jgi:hypothetical protein
VRRALLVLLLWPAALAAADPPVVVSPAPSAVAVTVYRDPDPGDPGPFDLEDPLDGFALISETRVVDLPPGPVTIRFEGVASGIQPETAILTGPDGREKNQDRKLLSRRGLIDAFTGQRVRVRRTDRATGKVTEEVARIRSNNGDVILETAAGFETLRCTGLSQTPIFANVPPTLSAKPVLSLTTADQPGGRTVVTLSYLADDFDWQANYVAELAPDLASIDLFATITLASRDEASFPQAQAAAVAGRTARAERRRDNDEEDEEDDFEDWYRCWPRGTTGGGAFAGTSFAPNQLPTIQAPVAIGEDEYFGGGGGGDEESIIVTGSRIIRPEAFGDYKLYRVPFPVTVAARSQKQVGFLAARRVKGELVYTSQGRSGNLEEPTQVFRFRNEKGQGLGQPLPAGAVTFYQRGPTRRALIGESSLEDKAVGEEVELALGKEDGDRAHGVSADSAWLSDGEGWQSERLTVTNANPYPIRYEAEFEDDADQRYERFSARTVRRRGRNVWSVKVPANGTARLTYRIVEIPEPPESEDEEEED